jgi:hypothetical protein
MFKPPHCNINLAAFFNDKWLNVPKKGSTLLQFTDFPLIKLLIDRSSLLVNIPTVAGMKRPKDRKAATCSGDFESVRPFAGPGRHAYASFAVEVARKVIETWGILWVHRSFLPVSYLRALARRVGLLLSTGQEP